jgi:hypothetical protein
MFNLTCCHWVPMHHECPNLTSDDHVNVFFIDDAKMKVLAQVISNKSSVTILNLLYRDELIANTIAQKTNRSL